MKTRRVFTGDTRGGRKGKVEVGVPKPGNRICKAPEVLCLCGPGRLHSVEKSHAKKKKKIQNPGFSTSSFQLPKSAHSASCWNKKQIAEVPSAMVIGNIKGIK